MESNKDAMRLKSVKRVDPHVTSIVDCAMRTALYNFEQDPNEPDGGSWTKHEVEGTLIMYTREAPPYNMLLIINKISKDNFIEALSPACEIQVKPPYLLFKNSKGTISGIWFSDEDDVTRIGNSISEKIKPEANPQSMVSDPVVLTKAPKGDIMSMLSHAHGIFESRKNEPMIINKVTSSNNDVVKPSPIRAGEPTNNNSPNNTVADFFALAGKSGVSSQPPTVMPPPSGGNNVPPSNSATNPVLQRLFQDAAAIGGQASVAVSVGGGVGTNPIAIPGGGIPAMHPHSPKSQSGMPMSLQELEGKLKENLHICQQNKDESYLRSPASNVSQHQMPNSSLLSPQVFTPSHFLENALDIGMPPPPMLTPGTCLGVFEGSVNGSNEPDQQYHNSGISLLTQEQLVQAFSMLLRNEEFVHKLHDAYVQSLTHSLKGST